MAETVFTTWSALHTAMLNALADFAANRSQVAEFELQAGGITRRYRYRTIAELKEGLTFAKDMMDAESGAAPARTYARNAGGRWNG
jgi:hypothetical protein